VFMSFAALLAGCSEDHSSSTLLASCCGSAGFLQSQRPSRAINAARTSITLSADEI
jgi:hypothetical protein